MGTVASGVVGTVFGAAGAAVVAALYERARGRASLVGAERRIAAVFTFRGNKVVRVESYANMTEALRAVGATG